MTGEFNQRAIELRFSLGEGSFGEDGSTQVTVTNHRVSCAIVKAGGAGLGGAHLVAYGLQETVMNRLSTLGMPLSSVRRNLVSIRAGDVDGTLTEVFSGTIINAFFNADDMPNTAFNVESYVSAFDAAKTVPATSYNGTVDAVQVLTTLAAKCDPALTIENHGVSVQISQPYYSGSVLAQIQAVVRAAHINYVIENGVLAIWPINSSRGTDFIDISESTGMIGYPSFTGQGIKVRTAFNPALKYGQQIKVTSSLKPANGTWTIYRLTYDLEAQMPHGRWECEVEAASQRLLQTTGGLLPQ